MNRLFLIAGPPAVGKTTLERSLLTTVPRLQLAISTVCRPPRSSEVDGQYYHFVSCAEFQAMDRRGEFRQRIGEPFAGHYYGLTYAELDGKLRQSDVVRIAQGQSLDWFKQYYATVVIFLDPPPLAELRRRLEQDSRPDVDARLALVEVEMMGATMADHRVPSGSQEETLDRVAAIIQHYRQA